MNQLELHKKIEAFFAVGPTTARVENVRSLLANYDAKQFFFAKADDAWLDWLWENGLLDEIKKGSTDSTRYSYRLPELDYLLRMAGKNPSKVAEIISSVKNSEGTFNPEVIDRFIWIIGTLPPEQIKTLTAKMRDEKWVYLMRSFRKSGYEFERITKALAGSGESGALLELAQSMLIVKTATDIKDGERGFSLDDPFYVGDLAASGIFRALADISTDHAESALKIVLDAIANIVLLGGKDEGKVFEYTEPFSWYDIDFFTLPDSDDEGSYRRSAKNLAVTMKKLIEKTLGGACADKDHAKRILSYIDGLPSCRSIWRMRLFALAQCPETFRDELRTAFFRVFEVGERYFEIEGGAEYNQALARCFNVLDATTDQREYVANVFFYFGATLDDDDKEKWRKRDGLEKLVLIKSHLTDHEKQKAKEVFGKSPDKLHVEPAPMISEMKTGFVTHHAPIDLGSLSIEKILDYLKSDGSPSQLKEKYKSDEPFNAHDAEGLGDALKEDLKARRKEYLGNIVAFFDRESIHPQYLYSVLRGVEDLLRDKQLLEIAQVGEVLKLFEAIRKSGESTKFEVTKERDSWLAGWIAVHRVMTDVLLYFLQNSEQRKEIHKTHREQIKDIIAYLLTIKDSPSKEDEKPEYGELYGVAINSVRGRAFEALVVFAENDGNALHDDVKALYKSTLGDDALAVRFMIGRYLATFYFRDTDFVSRLLATDIFPIDDPNMKDIYLATWEGYLSNTLYDKLFAALNRYYAYAISLDPKQYTQRKYFHGLDESLAVHLALAFAHLGLGFDDPLFKQFWSTPNEKRHEEFISFIGRSCLTRDQAGDEWLAQNKVSKEKLLRFWDWALTNVTEPKAFSGFGFWVNPDKEILKNEEVVGRMSQTLAKSGGDIDWDYGLLRRLPSLAENNGGEALTIIRNYLLDPQGNLNRNRTTPLLHQSEIKDALETIYKNADAELKQKVTDLINDLIEKGSSMFWDLKEIITKS